MPLCCGQGRSTLGTTLGAQYMRIHTYYISPVCTFKLINCRLREPGLTFDSEKEARKREKEWEREGERDVYKNSLAK